MQRRAGVSPLVKPSRFTRRFHDPTNNKYPFSAEYEYFRFYKWNQETTYPCSPTPSCLSAADTADSRNNPKETNYPN